MKNKIVEFDKDRNSEFIDDLDAAEKDWLKNQEAGRKELIKQGILHPKYWNANDFREYYEERKKNHGQKEAWDMVFEKILERDIEPELVEVDGLYFVASE